MSVQKGKLFHPSSSFKKWVAHTEFCMDPDLVYVGLAFTENIYYIKTHKGEGRGTTQDPPNRLRGAQGPPVRPSADILTNEEL